MVTDHYTLDAPTSLLLVEDDHESGIAVAAMLERRGVLVTLVTQAEQAMAKLAAETYDIVVSDIRLGTITGVDLLRHVRRDYGKLPVILVTGFDSLNSAIEAVRLGAQDYILKPFESIEVLLHPVQKAVHTYRLEERYQQLQRELSASEARFRRVLQNSVDVVFEVDLVQNCIAYMSPSCTRCIGYTADELMAMGLEGVLGLFSDADTADINWEDEPPQSLDGPPLELRCRAKDGGERWLSINRSAVANSRGDVIAVVGNARDITELRQMREQDRQLREKLARAERIESLGIMAGGVAHDLNNILMPVVMLPSVVQDQLASIANDAAERACRDLDVVASAGKQAAAVVHDLLCLSRCQSIEGHPLNLNELVDRFLTSATISELERTRPDVDIQTDLDPAIPLVCGAGSQIYQALMNLALNGAEAMPNGGTLRIQTDKSVLAENLNGYEVIPPGTYVRLRVTDMGHGVDPDHIDRIFDPFYSRKEMGRRSGTGLGLAVVYGVTKGHDGYIDVTSVISQGTEFTLYLPVTDSPATKAVVDNVTIPRGTEHLLVVDDEQIARDVVVRILEELGYTVTAASGGREALEIIRSHAADGDRSADSPFDLVLLDMIMEKDFDGLHTFMALHDVCPAQKCMLITGYAESDRLREAQRLGAGSSMSKPFTMRELAQRIRMEIDGDA